MNPKVLADALIRPRRLLGDCPHPDARLAQGAFDTALHFRGSPASRRRALLVHGWETDHRDLETIADALVGLGFFCVLPDLPAHGSSAGETMMIPEAADALAIVERVHGPFDFCAAHSMGSAIVLAAHAKGLLHIWVTAFLAPPLNYVRQLSLSAQAAGAPQQSIAAALEILRSRSPGIDDIDSVEMAKYLRMPGLVVVAGRDRVLDPEDGRSLAAAWPESSLIELPDASHRSILRDTTTIKALCALADDYNNGCYQNAYGS